MKTDNLNTAIGSAMEAAAHTERHVEPISDAEWDAAVASYLAQRREARERYEAERRQLLLESVGTAF